MTDINDVYRQRNNLAIAFCKAALAAGWPAGRGVDDTKEPDDEWRHVVYVDLPSGDQVSWHMAPCAVHLLEGLPEYKGKWEGTFTARHKNWPALVPVQSLNPIEAAAKWVENRMQGYIEEHGSYDHETGYTELPGSGDEYVEELENIAEGIRNLAR